MYFSFGGKNIVGGVHTPIILSPTPGSKLGTAAGNKLILLIKPPTSQTMAFINQYVLLQTV